MVLAEVTKALGFTPVKGWEHFGTQVGEDCGLLRLGDSVEETEGGLERSPCGVERLDAGDVTVPHGEIHGRLM